ncbi:MAG: M48 family metallopeptidase [Pseudomonadota bacterium]
MARLSLDAADARFLVLETDGSRRSIPVDELSVSDRVGSIPRRLRWGRGETFVCSDNDAVDQLVAALWPPSRWAWLPRLEASAPLALAALVIVVGFYAGLLLWGVPTAAQALAQRLPDELLTRVAGETLDALDGQMFRSSRLPREERLALRARLLALDDFPRRIHFRASEIGPNAFALPGGEIVITDELVRLAGDPAEVEAVYLHEVGHARGRHAESTVLQSSAWGVLLAFMTGDVTGVSELLFALPVTLGQLSFSRDLETQADDFAIARLQALGRSPEPLASMLEKLGAYRPEDAKAKGADDEAAVRTEPHDRDVADPGEPSSGQRWLQYLSTHPATAERVARIREAAAR